MVKETNTNKGNEMVKFSNLDRLEVVGSLILAWHTARQNDDKKAVLRFQTTLYKVFKVSCVSNGYSATEAARECVNRGITAEKGKEDLVYFLDPGWGWSVSDILERINYRLGITNEVSR